MILRQRIVFTSTKNSQTGNTILFISSCIYETVKFSPTPSTTTQSHFPPRKLETRISGLAGPEAVMTYTHALEVKRENVVDFCVKVNV